MSVFKAEDMASEMAKQPSFTPLKENLYILQVEGVEEKMVPSYNDKSIEEEQIVISCKVVQSVDGSELEDVEGNYPKSNLCNIWCNPHNVGFNKKTNTPHKTRQVLTAILGIKVEDPIEIASWDDLLGKKFKAYMTVTKNQDGTPKGNKLDKFNVLAVPKK